VSESPDENAFDLDRIAMLKSELLRYNRMNLREVPIVKDGRRVSIPDLVLDEWEHTGLNNTDIVEFWEPGRATLFDTPDPGSCLVSCMSQSAIGVVEYVIRHPMTGDSDGDG